MTGWLIGVALAGRFWSARRPRAVARSRLIGPRHKRCGQNVLVYTQLRERPRNLKRTHDAEPRPQMRRDAADVATFEADAAAIGRDNAR